MKLFFFSLMAVALPTRYVVHAGEGDGVLVETADGFEYLTEPEARTADFDEFNGIVEDMNWDQYNEWNHDAEDRSGGVSVGGDTGDTPGGDQGGDSDNAGQNIRLSLAIQNRKRQRRNCNRNSVAAASQGGSRVNRGCRRLRGISHH